MCGCLQPMPFMLTKTHHPPRERLVLYHRLTSTTRFSSLALPNIVRLGQRRRLIPTPNLRVRMHRLIRSLSHSPPQPSKPATASVATYPQHRDSHHTSQPPKHTPMWWAVLMRRTRRGGVISLQRTCLFAGVEWWEELFIISFMSALSENIKPIQPNFIA